MFDTHNVKKGAGSSKAAGRNQVACKACQGVPYLIKYCLNISKNFNKIHSCANCFR